MTHEEKLNIECVINHFSKSDVLLHCSLCDVLLHCSQCGAVNYLYVVATYVIFFKFENN